MADGSKNPPGEIPLGQRLMDNHALLLVLGTVVMFAFFTIWGIVEMFSLPTATLP
jgi:hypothetical protein